MDVLTIAMTVAGGIKYLRGGCFVGDTLVVLDDGRRLPLCGEVIADASTSNSFAGWQSAGILTVLTVGVLGVVVAEDIRRREREEEARRARQLTTPAWPPDPDNEEDDEWLEALAHEHATEDSAWRESDDWLGADRECGFWDRTDDQAGSLAVVALPKLTRTTARERSAPKPQRASELVAVAPSAPTTAATAKSATRSSPRSWGILWLLLCLGICGAWKGTNWLLTPSKDLAAIGREVERPPLVTQKISEVPVGQWVLAENPELADEVFDPYEDLAPSQWRKLVLAMDKEDGSRLDIDLLRPLDWLEDYGAVVGQTIDLDLPELGAAGTSTVVAIEPCPALAPRPSERHHLVTGKFRHQVDELIDLHIEGLDEPITCTPNHLFWSEDRQEFVPAGDITRGSSLRPFSGSVDFLVRREGRENDATVYNLEVAVAHTYYVTEQGVLVHNACTRQLREAMNILRGGGHAHHIVPVGSFRGNADLIRARDVLERAGVSIESHYNGVMLPGAIHNKVHTNKYFTMLADRLEDAEDAADLAIAKSGLTGIAADNYRAAAAIGVLDEIKIGLRNNMTQLWR